LGLLQGTVLAPTAEFDKRELMNPTDLSMSVCLQKWLCLVGSSVASLVVHVFPAKAREMAQRQLLIR
jgi:hypothetical protein